MPIPGKLYYKLPELAKRWQRSESDLYQWAETGLIQISYKAHFFIAEGKRLDEYVGIPATFIDFFVEHERVQLSEFIGADGQLIHPIHQEWHQEGGGISKSWNYECRPSRRYFTWEKTSDTINRSLLVVMAEEVDRMEAEHPELQPGGESSSKRTTPVYLDTTLKEHAPKLAAAIAAWETVALKKLPPNKNPRQALITWLEDNLERFPKALKNPDGTQNNTAIEEIAKIANWKFQGAPKTGE